MHTPVKSKNLCTAFELSSRVLARHSIAALAATSSLQGSRVSGLGVWDSRDSDSAGEDCSGRKEQHLGFQGLAFRNTANSGEACPGFRVWGRLPPARLRLYLYHKIWVTLDCISSDFAGEFLQQTNKAPVQPMLNSKRHAWSLRYLSEIKHSFGRNVVKK